MTSGHTRLTTPEYGPYRSIDADSKTLGIDSGAFEDVLRRALAGAGRSGGLQDAFERRQDTYRFAGIVGLLTIAHGIELEIPPKFLPPDSDSWQDDLITVALLGRYGTIIDDNNVAAGSSTVRTVSDALGITLLEMCSRNRHKPIRAYRSITWTDPVIDGDIEPDAYWDLSADGFEQSGVILSRNNVWNSTIAGALCILAAEVSSSDIARQLRRRASQLACAFGRGMRTAFNPARVPARHKEWAPVYKLAHAIVKGGGLSFTNVSDHFLPGFIMRSNETWEEFLGAMLSLSASHFSLRRGPVQLGQRLTLGATSVWRDVLVTPDFRLVDSTGHSVAVVDAKYRTRVDKDGNERLAIAASDLYEVLAFMEASECGLGFLVYPTNRPGYRECGKWFTFDEVHVGSHRILGIGICVEGISHSAGVRTFAAGLRASLESNLV